VSNVLNEEKRQQVIALGRLGWSLRRIERAAHIRRETIGAYLRAAGIAVRPPGGWGRTPPKPANEVITDPTSAKPANEVIPDFGAELSAGGTSPSPSRSASASAPFRDAIELGLSRARNGMAIWQDLVDSCGFTGSYQSVQRFVRKLHPGNSVEACAVIETAPGEECQVDYRVGPMVRDPATGKYRRTRLFVMTLGPEVFRYIIRLSVVGGRGRSERRGCEPGR